MMLVRCRFRYAYRSSPHTRGIQYNHYTHGPSPSYTSHIHRNFLGIVHQPHAKKPDAVVVVQSQCRHYSNSTSLRQVQDDLSRSSSPSNVPVLQGLASSLGASENVRDYLKKWSIGHQAALKASAPEHVQPGKNVRLPNSLFARDAVEQDDIENEEGGNFDEQSLEPEDEDAISSLRTLRPGDAFILRSHKVKTQFAVYLGQNGLQGQLLLSNGCWFVDVQSLFGGHVIHDFATEEEMAPIRALMPLKPVQVKEAESSNPVLQYASGEVPFNICASILARFSTLAVEAEHFRREHARVLEDIYKIEASQTQFSTLPLRQLVKKHLHIDFDSLSNGAALSLSEMLFSDERFVPQLVRDDFNIVMIPRQLLQNSKDVVKWARSYQDAAARAATGKDVSDELKVNPLTNFVTKARRLISRSRKIRIPTPEGLLGPTMDDVRPESGEIVRKPTGEVFTDDEKKIIELVWHTHIRNPKFTNIATKRNSSVCSLVLRAVGAYPNLLLDSIVGQLFLQELGCLDPWYDPSEHNVSMPLHDLGLNYTAEVLREKEKRAFSLLDMDEASSIPPFPDAMVHIRKDWGVMEAFAIDSSTTRLVDDAISVEASNDYPGHHWIHIHIAHPSAFVPHDHAFVENARFMGAGYYGPSGSEPYMPWEVLDTLSISDNRPSHVMTCSTLLSSKGSVKDVKMQAGLLRNIVRLDKVALSSAMNPGQITRYELSVGTQKASHEGEESRTDHERQARLIEVNMHKLKLIQKLLSSRWDSRNEENPNYLTTKKLPVSAVEMKTNASSKHTPPYARLFRSEHCYGDPSITVSQSGFSGRHTDTYDDNIAKYDIVAGSMLLAGESFGFWARERGIPAIYRYQKCKPGFSIEELNALDSHEAFLAPVHGNSLNPSRLVTVNVAQFLHVGSPLRRYKDLLNQYQLNAYLIAEAAAKRGATMKQMEVEYPHSYGDILQYLQTDCSDHMRVGIKATSRHWIEMALFRAFHFNEAKLPDVWDVLITNPVFLGADTKGDGLTRGVIPALGIPVLIVPSEEGYEKRAAYLQILPVKIQSVDYRLHRVKVVAVGPSSEQRAARIHPGLT